MNASKLAQGHHSATWIFPIVSIMSLVASATHAFSNNQRVCTLPFHDEGFLLSRDMPVHYNPKCHQMSLSPSQVNIFPLQMFIIRPDWVIIIHRMIPCRGVCCMRKKAFYNKSGPKIKIFFIAFKSGKLIAYKGPLMATHSYPHVFSYIPAFYDGPGHDFRFTLGQISASLCAHEVK